MSDRSDVLVLGGGAIGLATAVELAQAGAKVTILSRNCAEAALFAAAGMLAPQAERIDSPAMLDLCLQRRAIYPGWVHRLEALTGLTCEYWPCGIIRPILDLGDHVDDRPATPVSRLDQGSSLASLDVLPNTSLSESAVPEEYWLDQAALQQQQPGLGPEVLGGWFYPKDAQVDNRKLGQVLQAAVKRLGVTFIESVTVEGFELKGDRIDAVLTNQGDWQADQYLLATGAWSGQLFDFPVTPRKGQMMSLVPTSFSSPCESQPPTSLSHVIFGDGIYIVPRRSGQIILGATSESVDFLPNNTVAGLKFLLNAASALVPSLESYTVQEHWWGYRPSTPDDCPILGESPYRNLAVATGHFRNGILLAPITAKLLAAYLLDGQSAPLLEAFHWRRFQDHEGHAGKSMGTAHPRRSVQFCS